MEQIKPYNLLKDTATEFSRFYDLCASKLNLTTNKEVVDKLVKKINKGPPFNLVTFGATKSGKSTFLNWLLKPQEEDCDVEIFLEGVNAETSCPWSFRKSPDLPSDIIHVQHINFEGEVQGHATFHDFKELNKHLKQHYSRAVVEKMKERNPINPFSEIQIFYGPPPMKLFQPLFETDLNIIDLQGIDEPGITTALKMLSSPFILICCINFATGFLRTTKYDFLKEIIQKEKPIHVLFIMTNIEDVLKKKQALYNEKLGQSKYKKCKINYDVLLQELSSEVNEVLEKDFPVNFFDVFYFDPYSDNEQLILGASYARTRLLDLRRDYSLDKIFYQEASSGLTHNIQLLKDELCVVSMKQINKELRLQMDEMEKNTNHQFDVMSTELLKILNKSINESLETRILNLTMKQKENFMADNPTRGKLRQRVANWIINDSLILATFEILEETCQKYIDKNKEVIDTLLQKTLSSINQFIEAEFRGFGFFSFFDMYKIWNLFKADKLFHKACAVMASFVCVITMSFVVLWIQDRLSEYSFEEELRDLAPKILEPIFKNSYQLYLLCEKVTNDVITNFKTQAKQKINDYYATKMLNVTSEVIENMKTNFGIDIGKLDACHDNLINLVNILSQNA